MTDSFHFQAYTCFLVESVDAVLRGTQTSLYRAALLKPAWESPGDLVCHPCYGSGLENARRLPDYTEQEAWGGAGSEAQQLLALALYLSLGLDCSQV